jgi:hypothetical protein
MKYSLSKSQKAIDRPSVLNKISNAHPITCHAFRRLCKTMPIFKAYVLLYTGSSHVSLASRFGTHMLEADLRDLMKGFGAMCFGELKSQ